MAAYYNEIDPYAAEWLKNLIAKGLIAPGEVDDRSIEDIRPDDLKGFTQCHFFAGIGVWSHSLRLAGWSDDRPVWTGSCPCQPFSAAGKGDGVDDERHLWPAWHHLISVCKPPVIFGEQVASKAGLGWFDLVQSDLEASGYAAGAVDLCAAGVGAPHIRQRLWIYAKRLADADGGDSSQEREQRGREQRQQSQDGGAGGVGNADRARAEARLPEPAERQEGHPEVHDHGGHRLLRPGAGRPGSRGADGGLADASLERRQQDAGSSSADEDENGRTGRDGGETNGDHITSGDGSDGWARPTNGFWRDADWLLCRDGKWRPVEPGTFPLAHGLTGRVGRLRAYGNAIVPQVAKEVISSFMEVENDT